MAADKVLVVNAGSSSLKLRLLDGDDRVVAGRDLPPPDDPESALADFVDEVGDPDAVGHRIVHGGSEFTEPTRLGRAVEERLERLSELAPLHNPPALRCVAASIDLRPEIPNVGCFDTAFHAKLPAEAATYALPGEWARRWHMRRFGFHGLSHAHASRRAAKLLDRPPAELRLVTAHLGSGASLAAVAEGRSLDTTMGFTPLEGLVMATRSGSLDPGLLLWVQRQGGIGPEAAERALEQEAGLLGLSGRSDIREVLAGIANGDDSCRLAFEVYMHRLAAQVAAMTASLGGLEALVFTGGVGENGAEVRAEACRRLEFLGLEIDPVANQSPEGDRDLSATGARAKTLVVSAREDLEIAAGVRAALRNLG